MTGKEKKKWNHLHPQFSLFLKEIDKKKLLKSYEINRGRKSWIAKKNLSLDSKLPPRNSELGFSSPAIGALSLSPFHLFPLFVSQVLSFSHPAFLYQMLIPIMGS